VFKLKTTATVTIPLTCVRQNAGTANYPKYRSLLQWPRGLRRVLGYSPSGIAGSNPAEGHGCPYLDNVACCKTDVVATGLSLVPRNPIKYGVSH
jgi:hypothetical protein